MEELKQLGINDLMRLLPHRYPFVLLDRVLDVKRGESIKAYKNVTINEPFFPGHFPDEPVMPGVLILESMAQAACVLTILSRDVDPQGYRYYFSAIDGARFKKTVVPGDRLLHEVKLVKQRSTIWTYSAKSYVDDKLVCKADLMCSAQEKKA